MNPSHKESRFAATRRLGRKVNPSDCRNSMTSSAISGALDSGTSEPSAHAPGISTRGHQKARRERQSERLPELERVARNARRDRPENLVASARFSPAASGDPSIRAPEFPLRCRPNKRLKRIGMGLHFAGAPPPRQSHANSLAATLCGQRLGASVPFDIRRRSPRGPARHDCSIVTSRAIPGLPR